MVNNTYKDYLIEKPLCLILWNLDSSPDSIIDFFKNKKDLEIKEIKNTENLEYWLKISRVENIILGIKNLEEGKDIQEYINKKLPMEKRREIKLIYILPEAKTLDPKETFLLSANLVVSEKHLSDIEKIYERAEQYWIFLYKDYKRAFSKYLETL
ncbi:hypothetical protein [Thermodesulfobacterium hydrogeniphilum]|uniref:hypothetical protein n=1 Tax=Thermodesulfobacterium hydrogeniphilum TaxID=161156 RepID=UPI00057201C2|nr:hypothetical protein [Thermodesulfobacterium hydrogeniphilum]